MDQRLRFRRCLPLAIAASLITPGLLQAAGHDRPTTVLFVGNSLTYYNGMPDTFARIVEAARPGTRVEVHAVTSGGAMLEDHWKLDWTRSRLAERHWDVVVLQDQGALSRWIADDKAHIAPPVNLDTYVDRFAKAARAAGSTVVLYETAPSRAAMEPYVAWAYTTAANRNHAVLAPVGRVFYAFDDTARALLLPKDNGGHPSPKGSCVVASTLAATIFHLKGQALVEACAKGDDTVRAAGLLIDRVLADVGSIGAYHSPPAPAFDSPPAVQPGDTVDAMALAGQWYAKEGGVPFTFGMVLGFNGAGTKAATTITSYGVNTREALPVEGLATADGVLRIDTRGNARAYHLALARHGDTLTGYMGAYVNGGTTYTPVTFTRRAGQDDYFRHLDTLQAAYAAAMRAGGLDQALPERYKALEAWLGKAEVERVAWGVPTSDAWTMLVTAQNFADRGDTATALAYYDYAIRHYPGTVDAYAARGQLLEHLGRYKEALPDLTLAADLLAKDRPLDHETELSWRRDRTRHALATGKPEP